jgi:hypothetical protein
MSQRIMDKSEINGGKNSGVQVILQLQEITQFYLQ